MPLALVASEAPVTSAASSSSTALGPRDTRAAAERSVRVCCVTRPVC